MNKSNNLPSLKDAFSPVTSEQMASTNIVSLPSKGQFLLPVPKDAPTPDFKHYELGKPVKVWPYFNVNNELMFYVCRFEQDGQKQIRSYICSQDNNGQMKWTFKWMPKNRPLMNAPKVSQAKFVVVFEGEPAVDAFQNLVSEVTASSFSGGCQRISQTDFSPLKGTNVFYWRDNDHAGQTAESEFCDQAYKAGANQIFVLRPDAMSDTKFCEGWDLADGEKAGWTRADVEAFMKSNMMKVEPPSKASNAEDFPFELNETGVYYLEIDRKGNVTPVLVSNPIRVLAKSRDFSGKNWGYQIEISDNDKKRHIEFIPSSWFSRKGNDVLDVLYSYDCLANEDNKAEKRILQYIRQFPTASRIRCVEYPGWQGDVFVTPEKVYGDIQGEQVVMTGENKIIMTKSGTLEEWQDNVAKYAQGNSRLVFAMSAALAAPLLYILGRENSGFHFRGDSSIGKTTLLNVAASIFGMKVNQWRSTDNHQEITNANHNHLPLFMDELAQLSQEAAEKMPYTIGNGQGKGRMTASGKARETYTWLLHCLSTGEISMQDKMSDKGSNRRETAGEENRFNDIPAAPENGHGIFETTHEFVDGKSLAVHLNQASRKHCGIAGDQFLNYVTQNKMSVITRAEELIQAFETEFAPENADPQVLRVLSRFAFVAAAGTIALEQGVLPWKQSEAFVGASTCFHAWLNNRGGIHSSEMIKGFNTLKENISRFSEKHFEDWNNSKGNDYKPYDFWGWKLFNPQTGSEEYLVDTTGLKQLTGGNHSPKFKEYLVEQGWLVKQKDGFVITKRTPRKTRQSLHVITPKYED
jgi:uncharacterized protein (DUF927 family)